jgi:hypothetical protein
MTFNLGGDHPLLQTFQDRLAFRYRQPSGGGRKQILALNRGDFLFRRLPRSNLGNQLNLPSHPARLTLPTTLHALFEAAELPAWENDSSFQQLLLSFESILPLRLPSEFRDHKVHQRILSLSEGVLVRICRLIETAATEAIHSRQEHISLALLKDDLVTSSLVSIVDRRDRCVSAR